MATLVVYDSAYGNTAQIAETIASSLAGGAVLRQIDDMDPAALPPCDLLVVGSPTQGGRPTAKMQTWLHRLPGNRLANVKVAAFDTRISSAEQGFALRTLMRAIGYAAPRISRSLLGKGGVFTVEPEGFIVEGREGPLRSGERDRATRWAGAISQS